MNDTNLLFIYTDEQAFNTLETYGNSWIEMPNLNRLASQSVVFDRAYVTQPVCTPSRSTLLTGQWPHTNGCVRNNLPLREDTRCLPEILPTGQYVTGHYGKWHLGDEIFRQHGFDEWMNYEDGYVNHYGADRDRQERTPYHHYLIEQGYEPDNTEMNVFGRGFCARLPEEHGKPAWIAQRSIDFIQRHKDRPFVLYVNFLEPHMPFFGPRDDQYDPSAIPLPNNLNSLPDNSFPHKYREKSERKTPEAYGDKNRSEEAWRKLRARYYGLCSLVDTHAGKILDALEEEGLWDNTVIVFTSDHGDMMGSHSQTAKGVMYEEAIRVPLLIKMPGQKQMKRVEGMVSHIDVMPTILDLMGLGVPGFVQGRSLKEVLLSDNPRLDDPVVIEWNNSTPDGQNEPNNPGEENDERAVLTPDGWKFVWTREGKHLLFNHNDDPGEALNLYGRKEHLTRVREMLEIIRSWQKQAGDNLVLPAL